MRCLLLGESPNEATEHRPELWLLPDRSGIPHSANRLLKLAGYTHSEFHRTFPVRDNLIHHLPEKAGRGRAFPRALASASAGRVHASFKSAQLDAVVVLGRRLSRAFEWHEGLAGGKDMLYFAPSLLRPRGASDEDWVTAFVVPHPSGVNQFWNTHGNRELAATFFAFIKESA